MLKVRNNVFETNSSSTHSLTYFTAEEWASLKNDPDVLINQYGSIISRAAAVKEYMNNFCDEYCDESNVTDDDLRYLGGYYSYNTISHNFNDAKCIELEDGSAVVSIYYTE